MLGGSLGRVPSPPVLLGVLLQRFGDLQPALVDVVVPVAGYVVQRLLRRRSETWVELVQLLLGHLKVWRPGR